jgi:hypothetical protein
MHGRVSDAILVVSFFISVCWEGWCQRDEAEVWRSEVSMIDHVIHLRHFFSYMCTSVFLMIYVWMQIIFSICILYWCKQRRSDTKKQEINEYSVAGPALVLRPRQRQVAQSQDLQLSLRFPLISVLNRSSFMWLSVINIRFHYIVVTSHRDLLLAFFCFLSVCLAACTKKRWMAAMVAESGQLGLGLSLSVEMLFGKLPTY